MDIESFIQYVATLDAGFPGRIAGASPSQVGTLEKLAGTALPGSYKSYLSRLGKNDGGLRIGQDSTTEIDEIIGYYEDIVKEGDFDEMIPADCVVIAYSGIRTFELALEIHGGTEPKVIYSSGKDKKGDCAESLEKLLYRTAYLKLRARKKPSYATYTSGDAKRPMGDLVRAARNLGFGALWYSDGTWHGGEREDVSLVAIKEPWHPLWVMVSSGDPAGTAEIGDALQKELDLKVIAKLP